MYIIITPFGNEIKLILSNLILYTNLCIVSTSYCTYQYPEITYSKGDRGNGSFLLQLDRDTIEEIYRQMISINTMDNVLNDLQSQVTIYLHCLEIVAD